MENGIVADGRMRWENAIRDKVLAEHAEELRRGTLRERVRVLEKVRLKIRDRIRSEVPDDALY